MMCQTCGVHLTDADTLPCRDVPHCAAERVMTYRANVEGFTGHFDSCEALKVWAEDLNRRHNLKGCTLKVWKALWVARDGSGAQYAAIPSREIVIGGL